MDQKALADYLISLGWEKPECRLCTYVNGVIYTRRITCTHPVATGIRSIAKRLRAERGGFIGALAPVLTVALNDKEVITIPGIIMEDIADESAMWPESYNPDRLQFCAFFSLEKLSVDNFVQ